MHSPLDNPAFIDAIVILGAAGIVIPAFTRFRITPIIGFILVGLLLGPSGLGSLQSQYEWLQFVTISDREAIEPFAEMGIILLLFSNCGSSGSGRSGGLSSASVRPSCWRPD